MLVFIQSDPWKMVIGSDTPRVAIYDTGEVIFLKTVKGAAVYHRKVLDKEAMASVRAQLAPVIALQNLKPHYSISIGTDQPVAMFYARDGQHTAVASVYGLRSGGSTTPDSEITRGRGLDAPPPELLRLHAWLCSVDFPDSEEWKPQYVEVMLWDYSYAPDPPIQWPAEWPGLESGRAVKRGKDYSIFLDGSLVPQLRQFLSSRKPKGAVELGKRKWAVSYRYTFPSEPEWGKAFQAADERRSHGG
jgi:hypothetical protein